MNDLLTSVLKAEEGRSSASMKALAAELENKAYEPWFDGIAA